MDELYETNYLKIVFDEEIQGLIITWIGFTSSENFKSGVDKIVSIMAERNIAKTITDLTEHRVIGAEDQTYAANTSIEFDRTHWKVKRAIITPKDVFTRFGIKQVNAQVAKTESQERRFFATIEEAKLWLNEEQSESDN